MKTSIVLGLGFGDEGKGLMTDYLCSPRYNYKNRSLVVRFSGGHQAGHTVKNKAGQRHVFSQFGSGTFRGATTYWSKYCTFCPTGFIGEYNNLRNLGVNLISVYVDALAPVVTPYDVFYNRALELSRPVAHGSCGVGFAATIDRSVTHKLMFQDLYYPGVLSMKLQAIKEYYAHLLDRINPKVKEEYMKQDEELALKKFHEGVTLANDMIVPALESRIFGEEFLKNFDHVVFEGSQGILLDMDFGFFPNVTKASTTSKNAMRIIERNGLPKPDLYYMTRAYQNRHGNGPMTNENLELNVLDNPTETNVENKWQGNLRKSILDLDLLTYAINCDRNFSAGCKKNIVLTCLDQLNGPLKVTRDGSEKTLLEHESVFFMLNDMLGANDQLHNIYLSHSDRSDDLVLPTSECCHA